MLVPRSSFLSIGVWCVLRSFRLIRMQKSRQENFHSQHFICSLVYLEWNQFHGNVQDTAETKEFLAMSLMSRHFSGECLKSAAHVLWEHNNNTLCDKPLGKQAYVNNVPGTMAHKDTHSMNQLEFHHPKSSWQFHDNSKLCCKSQKAKSKTKLQCENLFWASRGCKHNGCKLILSNVFSGLYAENSWNPKLEKFQLRTIVIIVDTREKTQSKRSHY